MPNFEEVGRVIGRELAKLERFFETEFKTTTEQKAAEALRKASQRLAELAQQLEERAAGKKT